MKTVKLFCLPYTGTSASYFYTWQRFLPAWVTLRPIELAGRGERMGEEFYASFSQAVEDLFERICSELSVPYLLLGNCMGAILCYEIALCMQRHKRPAPGCMVALGQGAPGRRGEFARLASLSDARLIDKVREMGGDPEHRLDDPELVGFYLPVLRADCRIYDGYLPKKDAKLSCNIAVVGGQSDPLSSREALEEWRDYTEGAVWVQTLPGGHYFAEEQTSAMIDLVLSLAEKAR